MVKVETESLVRSLRKAYEEDEVVQQIMDILADMSNVKGVTTLDTFVGKLPHIPRKDIVQALRTISKLGVCRYIVARSPSEKTRVEWAYNQISIAKVSQGHQNGFMPLIHRTQSYGDISRLMEDSRLFHVDLDAQRRVVVIIPEDGITNEEAKRIGNAVKGAAFKRETSAVA